MFRYVSPSRHRRIGEGLELIRRGMTGRVVCAVIEFKGECGHTIRAKDEDEGKYVHCGYCGAEAQVPGKSNGQLDELFDRLAEGEETEEGTPRKKRRWGTKRGARKAGGFDPVRTSWNLVSITLVLIVLIVVGKYGYRYYQRFAERVRTEQKETHQASSQESNPSSTGTETEPKKTTTRQGLLRYSLDHKRCGAYITSVPSGVRIYARPADDEDTEILGRYERYFEGRTPTVLALPPGEYDVALVVPTSQHELKAMKGYRELRWKIEYNENTDAVLRYLAPDGSEETYLLKLTNKQQCLARRYRVSVLDQNWTPVTGFFLPNVTLAERLTYVPDVKHFGFDNGEVCEELTYWGVDKADFDAICRFLARTGKLVLPDPQTHAHRSLEIDLATGDVVTRLIEGRSTRIVEDDQASQIEALLSELERASNLDEVNKALRMSRRIVGSIPPDRCSDYLIGGAKYNYWLEASTGDRLVFLSQMDSQAARRCVAQVGQMVQGEDDAGILNALLNVLIRAETMEAKNCIREAIKLHSERKNADDSRRRILLTAKQELDRILREKRPAGK